MKDQIRKWPEAILSLRDSAEVAGWSIEMFTEAMNDFLDQAIGALTPVQKSEYYHLVQGGAYPLDALQISGRKGRWVITKRTAVTKKPSDMETSR